jgi:hypothetical protein
MCLIITGTASNVLKQDLDLAWRVNSDGAGYIEVTPDNRVIYYRGLMKIKTLMRVLKNQVSPDSQLALHFRLATHGAVCAENTHPFLADPFCLLMHNGILSNFGSRSTATDLGSSDSGHLARILAKIDKDDRAPLLESLVGYTNKFLVCQDGIFNHYGTWHEHGFCKMSSMLLIPSKYCGYGSGYNNGSERNTGEYSCGSAYNKNKVIEVKTSKSTETTVETKPSVTPLQTALLPARVKGKLAKPLQNFKPLVKYVRGKYDDDPTPDAIQDEIHAEIEYHQQEIESLKEEKQIFDSVMESSENTIDMSQQPESEVIELSASQVVEETLKDAKRKALHIVHSDADYKATSTKQG